MNGRGALEMMTNCLLCRDAFTMSNVEVDDARSGSREVGWQPYRIRGFSAKRIVLPFEDKLLQD